MADESIDILMVTYNRPRYTELSLERLLETCDDSMRVWLWHNGTDQETLDVVRASKDHPRVHEFHHSEENVRLEAPINWLLTGSSGGYVCKVDDDCLMPHGWADTLRRAHREVPEFGVLGCWRFFEEDFEPDLAHRKIQEFQGHKVMRNCWVEGSGFLLKRRCIDEHGILQPGQGFTKYCIMLASKGWVNGWYFPFLFQEHMDDPRSSHSLLRTDEDLKRFLPLSASFNNVESLEAWQAQLRRSALYLQRATFDPRAYTGWRKSLKGIGFRLRKLIGRPQRW